MAKNMAKNKITLKQIDEALKDIEEDDYTFDWHGLVVVVKKRLNCKEELKAIQSIVDSCFSGEEETYLPEIRELATRGILIESYSNIPLPRKSTEKMHKIAFDEELHNRIIEFASSEQIELIKKAVDEKIKYRIQTEVAAIRDEIAEAYSGIEEMVNILNQAFGDVSPDDLIKAGNALADGSIFDERKAMQTWLDENRKLEEVK